MNTVAFFLRLEYHRILSDENPGNYHDRMEKKGFYNGAGQYGTGQSETAAAGIV